MDQVISNPQSSKTIAILGIESSRLEEHSVSSWLEPMLLLGSKAAATPDSLDEDDQTSPLPAAQLPWSNLCWLLNPKLLNAMLKGQEDDDHSLITPSISALLNSKDINLLKNAVTEHLSVCGLGLKES